MNAMIRSWAVSTALLALAGASSLGCNEEKKQQVTDQDAGDEKKPIMGSRLAAAVKAAQSANANAPKSEDGPPESGVFGPGLADKAFAPGAPAKVEAIDKGPEPRVAMAYASADEEQKMTASLSVRLQGGMIPVDYTLSLKLDKPKDDKAKDKDKDKKDGPKSWRVAGKITTVGLPPQVPHDLADKLGKLKGTEVSYAIGESSGATDIKYTLPKDADAALGDALDKTLVDAIQITMPPLPRDAMGVGGYWMVTDRSNAFGAEVVRYRVYKVEKIEKDRATLAVDVRQYAAKDDVDLWPLIGGVKLGLERVESQGKAKLVWTAGGLGPAGSDSLLRTVFVGHTGDQKQAVLQADVTAKLEANKADKNDKAK